MNALARTFELIFGPPWWKTLSARDQQFLSVARPFLERMDRLSRGWQREDVVCDGNLGMSIIGARCFWAKQLGLIEYKRRWMRKGWWIRLTPKGQRYLRESME